MWFWQGPKFYKIVEEVIKPGSKSVLYNLLSCCLLSSTENNQMRLWSEDLEKTTTASILFWLQNEKHCQRHNGPEGWVHITKVTSWVNITISNTNLDQISSSESWLKNQFLNQTSASLSNSKSRPNIASESRPRFNFITSTKHQHQNAEQTPASKSCLNFNFKILTNPCAQSLNKSLALWPNLGS